MRARVRQQRMPAWHEESPSGSSHNNTNNNTTNSNTTTTTTTNNNDNNDNGDNDYNNNRPIVSNRSPERAEKLSESLHEQKRRTRNAVGT